MLPWLLSVPSYTPPLPPISIWVSHQGRLEHMDPTAVLAIPSLLVKRGYRTNIGGAGQARTWLVLSHCPCVWLRTNPESSIASCLSNQPQHFLPTSPRCFPRACTVAVGPCFEGKSDDVGFESESSFIDSSSWSSSSPSLISSFASEDQSLISCAFPG